MCSSKNTWKFAFFNFFGGSPLHIDKEKCYYMYIEQFLKNVTFLIFLDNFVTSILKLVLNNHQCITESIIHILVNTLVDYVIIYFQLIEIHAWEVVILQMIYLK